MLLTKENNGIIIIIINLKCHLPNGNLNVSCARNGSKAATAAIPGKFGGSKGLGPKPNGENGPTWPAKQSAQYSSLYLNLTH